LIEIYKKLGKEKEYKEELLYQIFSCNQNDLVYVNQLKLISSMDEWCNYREKLLRSKTGWSIHYSLLEAEGLYKQLLTEVLNKNEIGRLDHFEKVLYNEFPEQVCAGYISYIIKQAERVSDRNGYRHLIQYLKKVAMYSCGKKKAFEIAAAWKKEYRRRPAMMDELRKAGF